VSLGSKRKHGNVLGLGLSVCWDCLFELCSTPVMKLESAMDGLGAAALQSLPRMVDCCTLESQHAASNQTASASPCNLRTVHTQARVCQMLPAHWKCTPPLPRALLSLSPPPRVPHAPPTYIHTASGRIGRGSCMQSTQRIMNHWLFGYKSAYVSVATERGSLRQPASAASPGTRSPEQHSLEVNTTNFSPGPCTSLAPPCLHALYTHCTAGRAAV